MRKFLVFIIVIIIIMFSYLVSPINTIYIEGNNYYSDQAIIDTAGIDNNSSYLFSSSINMRKKLEKMPLINTAKIDKKPFNVVEIKVVEKEVLLYDKTTNKYILDTKESYNNFKFSVPVLMNYTPKKVFDKFIDKFKKLSPSIRSRISEIIYEPDNYDDERFLMLMNDHNKVYINVANMNRLSVYDESVSTLDGKIGTLYMDSSYGDAIQFIADN